MSLLQYRSSSSFAPRTPLPRPVSNASSSQAFTSSDPASSDIRGSGSDSDPSPTTPSIILPHDAAFFPGRHVPSPNLWVGSRVPSPLSSPHPSPYLESWSEPRKKGPLHPGLAEFQTEVAFPSEQPPLVPLEVPGAVVPPHPSSPVESPVGERQQQRLKPLFLAARASSRLSNSSRPGSAQRSPSSAGSHLRQLQLPSRSSSTCSQLPVRSSSALSRSFEDLNHPPDRMLRLGSNHGTSGNAFASPKMSKTSLRYMSRPLTAPDAAPNTHEKPAPSARKLPRPARPHTSTLSPEPNVAGDAAETPAPLLLAARLASQPPSRSESESWKTPGDTDGDFVRKTYAYFAHAGVPGDGFTEGKEYTRERAKIAAWEEGSDVSPYMRSRAVTAPSSVNGAVESNGGRLRAHSAIDIAEMQGHAKASVLPRTPTDSPRSLLEPGPHPAPSGTASPSAASVSSNGRLHIDLLEAPGGMSPSAGRGPIQGTLSTQSTASEAGRFTSAEWQRQREAEEEKRIELMGKVDRYGFFFEGDSLPSHNRTILLPRSVFAAPFPRLGKKKEQPSSTDPVPADLSSGIQSSDGPEGSRKQQEARRAQDARAAADHRHRNREQERIVKWSKMLEVTDRDEGHNAIEHGFVRGVDKRLRRRIYKGIPDIWRAAAWSALILRHSGSVEGRTSGQKSKSGARDERRLQATGTRRDHSKRFSTLLPIASPHDVQIDLDVPRTIGGHVQFHTRYGQGQRSLFHVLHAISLLCPDCGYCQGMGPIAATLLCYFSPDQAYAAMVMLHHTYSLHSTFSPGFPGLVENFYVQNQLVKTYMPEIASKMDEQMVVTSAFATKWYITLFSNTVPFETQLRIWDAWLLEGQDVINLVAVAILWSHRAKILSPQADFETILGALSGYFVPEDDDALLGWIDAAMQRKDVRQMMHASRKEWQRLVETGESSNQIL
ncbi:hypothetical protein ACQY0O_005733 [Thecaphora frezii]